MGDGGAGEATVAKRTYAVNFEYNGTLFEVSVAPKGRIEGGWHQALTHFGIKPGDVEGQNLGLFKDGDEITLGQSFEDAGVSPGTVLRIQPRVQRAG